MRVSKLEAARRQLEVAIALYFHDGDPVSIHTLTGAAYEILRGINKTRQGEPMLKDSFRNWVKPEFADDFGRRLSEAQTFFKHAFPNPDGTVDFEADQTNFFLLDACFTYRRLAGERLPLLATFETWSALTWASSFMTYPGIETLDQDFLAGMSRLSRQEYFARFVPIAHQAMLGSPDA